VKIAAFFSDSPYASWGQSQGFAAVLRRMGHEVVDIAIPPVKTVKASQVAKINKPIDECDLVIVSGPEHLKDWIRQFYPEWNKLKAPKVGWYHESFQAREDYKLTYADFEGMFDVHCFPDRDDAQKCKGEWLPLGIDLEMFKDASRIEPTITLSCQNVYEGDKSIRWAVGERGVHYESVRDIDAAFIGLMYPKRVRFLESLQPLLDAPLRIVNGSILVQDIDGLNVKRSTELLAETYRRIKVFVAFPSICNVLVAKILEAMASGCLLVGQQQPIDLDNYLPYSTPAECAEQIRGALAMGDAERERMIQAAQEELRTRHAMELRFKAIFQLIGESKQCAS
jgi:glycosyltransferase involved in cell wall biosynthesis